MKAEWDRPTARERTDVFPRRARAQSHIAVCFVGEDFDFRGRNNSPARIAAVRRDEISQSRQGIENAHRRRGCKISRKKTKVKSWFALCRAREGATERCLIGTAPVK